MAAGYVYVSLIQRMPAGHCWPWDGAGIAHGVLASLTCFFVWGRAVVVSERLEERVKMCEIRSEIYGASDHCPVVLELAGPL